MEWQPIETAPKDESEVLLWDDGVELGRWYENPPSWNGGDWWIQGGQITSTNPTHWMPLPTAPNPQEPFA